MRVRFLLSLIYRRRFLYNSWHFFKILFSNFRTRNRNALFSFKINAGLFFYFKRKNFTKNGNLFFLTENNKFILNYISFMFMFKNIFRFTKKKFILFFNNEYLEFFFKLFLTHFFNYTFLNNFKAPFKAQIDSFLFNTFWVFKTSKFDKQSNFFFTPSSNFFKNRFATFFLKLGNFSPSVGSSNANIKQLIKPRFYPFNLKIISSKINDSIIKNDINLYSKSLVLLFSSFILHKSRKKLAKLATRRIVKSYAFDSFQFAELDSLEINSSTPTMKLSKGKFMPFFNLICAGFHNPKLKVNAYLSSRKWRSHYVESSCFFFFFIKHFNSWKFKRSKKKSRHIEKFGYSLFTNKNRLLYIPNQSKLLWNFTKKKTLSNYAFYEFSSLYCILNLFSNPLLFKFIFFSYVPAKSLRNFSNFIQYKFENETSSTFLFDRWNKLSKINLLPNTNFYHVIEKEVLKVVNVIRLKPLTTTWQYHTLVRFFEFCTGLRIFLKFFSFISNCLSFSEKALCAKWAPKVYKFRKLLGTCLFLEESLQIMYIALKLKDPYFLSNWLTKIFSKIDFWKFKILFRYMKYILKHFFYDRFESLLIKGVKMQLSGKISVSGNARTRTVRLKSGITSHSTIENKILTVLSLIPTFTGIQGFKIWFIF